MPTEIDSLEIRIKGQADSAVNSIDKLISRLNILSTSLTKVNGSSLVGLDGMQGFKGGGEAKFVRLANGINRVSASAEKSKKSFGGLASSIGKFYASYFLVIRGIKALWRSINTTADYVEAFNYYTVSFGKIASKWDENWENYGDENARNYSNSFVTTMNDTFKKLSGVSYDPQTGLLSETGLKNLGLNLQEVTQFAAQLGSMMDAVGHSGETTLATTNAFVRLAGDISSLYNIDYSEAAGKLRSVLQGQSRAGYGFGWDTTMASLQATADELNLSKAVSEMSQMEKQQLRILTILSQSRVAYGDQSNTINTLANQLRLLKNNIKEASMMLGQLFVPILSKLIPVINGTSIAIKRLLSNLASIFGIKIEDTGQGFTDMKNDAENLEDTYDDLAESIKEVKNQMLGFDEAEKLTTINATSNLDGTGSLIDLSDEILKATSAYEKVWQEAYDKMNSGTQLWADKIEKTLVNVKRVLKDIVLGDYIQAGEDFSKLTLGLTNFVGNAIRNVDWGKAGKSIGEFLAGVDWTDIFLGLGDIVISALEGAWSAWFSMLKEAPFETALLSAIALWKFSSIGNSIASKIATAIGISISQGTAEGKMKDIGNTIGTKIEFGLVTAVGGYKIGNIIYESATGKDTDSIPNQIKKIYGATWEEIVKAARMTFGDFGSYIKNEYLTDLKITANKISEYFKLDKIFDFKKMADNFKRQLKEMEDAIANSGLVEMANTFATGSPTADSGENETLWEWLTNSLLGSKKTNLRGGVRGFATGGFPEDGLFFANHNELVGKFNNGKTAVANSYQIEAGIEQASYRGMARALAEHQGNGGNVTVVLQGEADNLFKVVQSKANNYTMQTGKPAFIV